MSLYCYYTPHSSVCYWPDKKSTQDKLTVNYLNLCRFYFQGMQTGKKKSLDPRPHPLRSKSAEIHARENQSWVVPGVWPGQLSCGARSDSWLWQSKGGRSMERGKTAYIYTAGKDCLRKSIQ